MAKITSLDVSGEIPAYPPEKLLQKIAPEATAEDESVFLELINTTLAPWQEKQVTVPSAIYPAQREIIAVHWHPEYVPMPLIRKRMAAMFPNTEEELCIPTQHNELLELGDYAGVEIDCFSRAFNQKVQLLAHFKADRLREANVFRGMLAHTYNYRSLQLSAFLQALCDGQALDRAPAAVKKASQLSGADFEVTRFAACVAFKLKALIDKYHTAVPREMLKNKLLRNMLDAQRQVFGDIFIDRVQSYARELKALVKENFSSEYYYLTSEVIEEVRGLGGCLIIPHPEQFWPILLAGYDVDGYEVWNPQSHRYTEFLISVVEEQNKYRPPNRRKLLILMGDDCHLSEKTRPLNVQDAAKASREVGLQPAWDEFNIRKKLISAKAGRKEVIEQYKERLEA